jgi:hypothetical protein
MAMTAEDLANEFSPRPRTCAPDEDWRLARKDAAKAIELLGKDIWNEAVEAAALVVQPTPHVDEERQCQHVAEAVRKLKK